MLQTMETLHQLYLYIWFEYFILILNFSAIFTILSNINK